MISVFMAVLMRTLVLLLGLSDTRKTGGDAFTKMGRVLPFPALLSGGA